MKRFLRKTAYFFPVILIIIIINVTMDPANIYKKKYEEKIAELLLSGKNVTGMTNYDERLLQEIIIKREKICPSTIILGSSRVMGISGETIDISDCRNHGVSGASFLDYLGILGVYETCDKRPDQIILGLDPWILNENNGDSRYQTLIEYINEFQNTLQDKPKTGAIRFGLTEKQMQLLSIPYFQSSIKNLLQTLKENGKLNTDINFYALPDNFMLEDTEGAIFYADGSRENTQKDRNKTINDINADARKYVTGSIYHIENYDCLCESYCELLEDMVEYMQNKKINVIFYLPPYHPYVYQYLVENSTYKNVFEAENYFINLAKEKQIDVYGSYNPNLLECTEEDFMDGMHMKRSSVRKSWQKL